jgi:hypothetical protein
VANRNWITITLLLFGIVAKTDQPMAIYVRAAQALTYGIPGGCWRRWVASSKE